MGALDKNCHRNLFKKGLWNLWSNSLKKSHKGFILIKKDFLRIFPTYNHIF